MSITCLGCPSFLRKDEASVFFEIEAAGPMCARFGYVYGHNDEAAENALESYAKACSAHGNDRPLAPLPNLEMFGSTYKPRPELLEVSIDAPSTCHGCQNYDDQAGACAALGKMIFPGRDVIEAEGCPWSTYKNSLNDPNRVGELLPLLVGSTVNVAVAVAAPVKPKRRGPVKPPRLYEGDAEVAEDDREMIRAYRQVDTRRGPVYLPIFHTDFFGDRADLIPDPMSPSTSDPSLYIDHAGLLERFAVMVYTLDMNLMLVGEPGSGKTQGAEWLAWMLNMPFERLPFNEESKPDMFLGSYQYGDTGKVDPDGKPILGTYFKPGLLPIAWEQAGVLLSDEINLPEDAIQQSYRSMNDSSRVLVVYDQKFKRHDYCFHIGAINPAHDFRNIGARPMASADSSRWSFMHMPNPDNDMIRKVLVHTIEKLDKITPDPFMITTIIKIGEDLRAMSRDGKLPDFWTLRQEVKVARLIPFFGVVGAYNAAYLDYVDPATRELVETSIRSHIPSGTMWAD